MKSGGLEKAVGDWGSELGPGAGDTSLKIAPPLSPSWPASILLSVTIGGGAQELGTPSCS